MYSYSYVCSALYILFFIVPTGTFGYPDCGFSSVVRQMPGYNSQRTGHGPHSSHLVNCVVLRIVCVDCVVLRIVCVDCLVLRIVCFDCVVLRIVCFDCVVLRIVCVDCVVLCIVSIVLFYVLFVCKCVLYYCHRVST